MARRGRRGAKAAQRRAHAAMTTRRASARCSAARPGALLWRWSLPLACGGEGGGLWGHPSPEAFKRRSKAEFGRELVPPDCPACRIARLRRAPPPPVDVGGARRGEDALARLARRRFRGADDDGVLGPGVADLQLA